MNHQNLHYWWIIKTFLVLFRRPGRYAHRPQRPCYSQRICDLTSASIGCRKSFGDCHQGLNKLATKYFSARKSSPLATFWMKTFCPPVIFAGHHWQRLEIASNVGIGSIWISYWISCTNISCPRVFPRYSIPIQKLSNFLSLNATKHMVIHHLLHIFDEMLNRI